MAAVSITRRPTANPVHAVDAIHLKANDVDSVNEETNAEIRYYMTLEATGEDTLRSVVFSGDYEWQGVVFPAAGSWTAHLRAVADDSSVANLAITVE